MPFRHRRITRLGAVSVVCATLACGIPRDPEGTLERVRGGPLRVGVIHAPPWVTVEHLDSDPRGLEIDLVAGPPGENAWLRVVEAHFKAHAPETT